jgi:TldD protein
MQSTLERTLSTALIEQLLALALAKGGDFAEVYVERGRTHSLSLEEHKIRGATYAVTLGVGIRVLAGTEVGYAFCDDLDTQSLRHAAEVAASIAHGGGQVAPQRIGARPLPNRYPVAVPLDTIAAADKADLLRRSDAAAHAYDNRISQVMGAFVDQTRDVLIATSEGLLTEDTQTLSRIHISAIATQGPERRTGFHGGGGRVDFAHYKSFSPEQVGREAARMATAQLGAQPAPAGPQTVVLSPGWSGILLHEAVGHGLEADFIRKGTSLYAGKLGEKVASELCTVVDNGTLLHRRGTLNVDDEGQIAEENVLIERGILKGYMCDRLNGRAMNTRSTGSGRRQSYQHAPMPRMTNTYMAAGAHDPAEILESVQNGLFCAAFGGGQVDIANGNFVFEVREGYRIENGKLGAPVANATLIGVGPDALKNISMVGNDPALDPGIGTCGKDGQTVPVGVGLPTVRMDHITVGGTQMS